jgi:hypothetical protein
VTTWRGRNFIAQPRFVVGETLALLEPSNLKPDALKIPASMYFSI